LPLPLSGCSAHRFHIWRFADTPSRRVGSTCTSLLSRLGSTSLQPDSVAPGPAGRLRRIRVGPNSSALAWRANGRGGGGSCGRAIRQVA